MNRDDYTKILVSSADDESKNLELNILQLMEFFPDATYDMTYEQLLEFKKTVKKDIPADVDPSRLVTVTFVLERNPVTNQFDKARIANSNDSILQIKQRIIQENQRTLAAMSQPQQTVPVSQPFTIAPVSCEPDKTASNSKEPGTSSKTALAILSNRTLTKPRLSIYKRPELKHNKKSGDTPVTNILHSVQPPTKVLNVCGQQHSTPNQQYLDMCTKEITFERARLIHELESNLREKKTPTMPGLEPFTFPPHNDFDSILKEKKKILLTLATFREIEALSQLSSQELPIASTSQPPSDVSVSPPFTIVPVSCEPDKIAPNSKEPETNSKTVSDTLSSRTLTKPTLSIDKQPELQSNNKLNDIPLTKILYDSYPPLEVLNVCAQLHNTPNQEYLDKCIKEITFDGTDIVDKNDLITQVRERIIQENQRTIAAMWKSRQTVPVSQLLTMTPVSCEPDKTASNSKEPETSSKTASAILSNRILTKPRLSIDKSPELQSDNKPQV